MLTLSHDCARLRLLLLLLAGTCMASHAELSLNHLSDRQLADIRSWEEVVRRGNLVGHARDDAAIVLASNQSTAMVYCVQYHSVPRIGTPEYESLELAASDPTTLAIYWGVYTDGWANPPPLWSKNIHVVDLTGTTWATGRNRLLRLAERDYILDTRNITPQRRYRFDYVVMADADIFLWQTCCTSHKECAVARAFLAPSHSNGLSGDFISPERTHICRQQFNSHLAAKMPKVGVIAKKRAVLEALWSQVTGTHSHSYYSFSHPFPDAFYNVFRHDVVDSILPYNTAMDDIGYWHAQIFVWLKAVCLFGHNHTILALASAIAVAEKEQHSGYPRTMGNLAGGLFSAEKAKILNDPRCVWHIRR